MTECPSMNIFEKRLANLSQVFSDTVSYKEAQADIERLHKIILTEHYNVELQRQAARILRKLAADYLEHGEGTVAKNFRKNPQFKHTSATAEEEITCENYLKGIRGLEWGTDIELQALAELFGFGTIVKRGEAYIANKSPDIGDVAPVMQVENSGGGLGSHWQYIDRSGTQVDTSGDGNCLYNAIALALRDIVRPQQELTASIPSCAASNSSITSASLPISAANLNSAMLASSTSKLSANSIAASTIEQPVVDRTEAKKTMTENTRNQDISAMLQPSRGKVREKLSATTSKIISELVSSKCTATTETEKLRGMELTDEEISLAIRAQSRRLDENSAEQVTIDKKAYRENGDYKLAVNLALLEACGEGISPKGKESNMRSKL